MAPFSFGRLICAIYNAISTLIWSRVDIPRDAMATSSALMIFPIHSENFPSEPAHPPLHRSEDRHPHTTSLERGPSRTARIDDEEGVRLSVGTPRARRRRDSHIEPSEKGLAKARARVVASSENGRTTLLRERGDRSVGSVRRGTGLGIASTETAAVVGSERDR